MEFYATLQKLEDLALSFAHGDITAEEFEGEWRLEVKSYVLRNGEADLAELRRQFRIYSFKEIVRPLLTLDEVTDYIMEIPI